MIRYHFKGKREIKKFLRSNRLGGYVFNEKPQLKIVGRCLDVLDNASEECFQGVYGAYGIGPNSKSD